MNNKAIAAIAAVVGVLCLIVGVLYFTQPANALPSFLPGHSATGHEMHTKHGIAAIVVGVACFVFGWFASGKKSTSSGAK
jgi:uncharacterized membrane protein HdeD (DUF308 family)